ncbi:MAG: DUF4043 family protein [Gammaproteobacteria bacterium]
MANTTTNPINVHTRHLSEYFREYVRMNKYKKYTGTSQNNVIVAKEESVTGRQKISIPAVGRLSGAGVSGTTTLRGSGEAMKNFGMDFTPTYYRNAVEFTKEDLEQPNFDMFAAARPQLMDWAMEGHRDRVVTATESVTDNGTQVTYGSASEAQKDAWAVDNVDRILYGAAKGNDVGGDNSASLLNVDGAADKADAGMAQLAKRIAKTADPRISPIRVNDDEEWFINFVDSLTYRDLAADTTISQANREAWTRGPGNPLFTGGDLIYDGMIFREIEDMNILSGVGATASDVGRMILCGQQAVGWAIGRRPTIITDMDEDYEFQPGIAVEHKEDVLKYVVEYTTDRWVDWGQVTVFTSATADS